MKILVTGANGFIGKNLVVNLKMINNIKIQEFNREADIAELELFTRDCDFVFHLAGANRPSNISDYMIDNLELTNKLIELLQKNKNACPVLFTSSTQATLDNPYGSSKKAGEEVLFNYGQESGAKILIYRLSNVFGKWCRPHYNSVVATFCYNIARDIPIKVNDPDVILNLIYIDDLVEEFINALNGKEFKKESYCYVPVIDSYRLGEIVELLNTFKTSRNKLIVPNMSSNFIKKLYSTYLSYLPTADFSYDLEMKVDSRGSFTEFIKTIDRGQVSVNISKPGIVKGNHWHNTKVEKFLVVSGTGVIRFKRVDEEEILEYFVSGYKLQVLDIPPGYAHNIENIGENDLITIIWANEFFDESKPDTYYLDIMKDSDK